ncbi:MAG: phytoene desaturase family protein [Amaricoccus sp.]
MFTRAHFPSVSAKPGARPPAVVVGAGLGGLAAAMRLGAKGYRVTVVDRLDTPGGRASAVHRRGFRFDLGPTIVTVPQLFRDLWAACGRNFDADVDLRPLDPFYQIRFADGSAFAARARADDMRAEVARLSPADLDGYERFLAESAVRYRFGFEDLGRRPMHRLADLVRVLPTFARLRADRSVHAHVARRVRDPRLRMALSFHPLFIGGDPFRVTSIYILVSHLERAFGVHYAMGGVGAIARAMADVITEQGGEVRLGEEVAEIGVRNGAVTGVRTASGGELRASVVVSNSDPAHTYGALLGSLRKRRWTPRRLDRSRWSMGLFVWYFGTRGTRALWPSVGHHTILSGQRYEGLVRDVFNGRLTDDMSLYVHRPTVTDPTAAPAGGDAFYALVPVPHLGHPEAPDWDALAEPFRRRVAAVLEESLLPGLQETVAESLVFTPSDFRDRYHSRHGCGFSIEPRILQSAFFRPHNVSEEVRGLYLAGAGTHPGAGLPGVVASAEVIARLVPDARHVVAA